MVSEAPVLWLCWSLLAVAADPTSVSLPLTATDAWAEPLAVAGLVRAAPSQADVLVEDLGATWGIRVVGSERSALLPAPTTLADMEGIVWMVASLAEPLWQGALPPSDPTPRRPRATAVVPIYDGSRRTDVDVPVPTGEK